MLTSDIHVLFTSENLDLLRNHRIKTSLDFVQCNNEKLCTILSCPVVEIIKIKELILSSNGSKALRAGRMFQEVLKNTLVIGTGIKELDRCIGGGLSVGTITEIYGSSISGKTQIALHFAANAAINHSQRVGFFSTSDLNASRLHDIMCCINRKMQSDGEHQESLKRVQFCHLPGIYELFDVLWHPSTKSFRVVIIDSLATLFSPVLGDAHNDAISLLNKVASDLKRLSVTNRCAILVINHVSNWQKNAPALGRYWLQVPHLRLQSRRLDDGQFQLTVVHNVFNPVDNGQCCFRLPVSQLEKLEPS